MIRSTHSPSFPRKREARAVLETSGLGPRFREDDDQYSRKKVQ
jgi:hypothetical protein